MELPEDKVDQAEIMNQDESAQDTLDQGVNPPVNEAVDETIEAEPTSEEALARALEDVERYKDVALRAQAEVQNIQRRSQRDVENAHKFGVERFLTNLIPVVDSIEKAVEACDQASSGEDDPIAEGIKLCCKLLIEVMVKEGVVEIEPVGEPFDPNEHQAVVMVDNPDMEPNSVFAVAQKGFKLNGRLVRPAMVMVTKAPEAGS